MTTPANPDDLLARLRAQLDDDERVAPLIHYVGCAKLSIVVGQHPKCDCGIPARVLAEVDAKRRILDEHQNVNDGDCGTCVNGRWGYPTHGGSTPQPWPCSTLRLLALPFADREGFREEWRPA